MFWFLITSIHIQHGQQQCYSSHLAQKEQTLVGGTKSPPPPQVIWLNCLQTTAVTEQKRLDECEAAADRALSQHNTDFHIVFPLIHLDSLSLHRSMMRCKCSSLCGGKSINKHAQRGTRHLFHINSEVDSNSSKYIQYATLNQWEWVKNNHVKTLKMTSVRFKIRLHLNLWVVCLCRKYTSICT